MPARRRKPGEPLIQRSRLDAYAPHGYLWASFPNHMKAGAASLAPFAVLFFLVQSVDEAMFTLVSGGLLVTPIVILAYSALWALMSYAVTSLVRRNTSVVAHYGAYAVSGAAALTAAALVLSAIWTLPRGMALWDHAGFAVLMTWAPPLGALGALIGRLVLRGDLDWYEDVQIDASADALRFETRKRDKDDWEQL